ncbi:hypothetical protein Tco_0766188 [Tanacetum coccineum]
MLLVRVVPPVESCSTKRNFPPGKSNRGGSFHRMMEAEFWVVWGYAGRTRKGKGESLCFRKFMCGVLPMSVVRLSERVVMWVTKFAVVAVWASILVVKDLVASIKAVSWVVLRSAAVLVAEMSCVRISVSGGWLSSPVVSRRGGMAAGELRMKAPNDGTTTSTGEERKS